MKRTILTVAVSACIALSLGCEHFKRDKGDKPDAGGTKHAKMAVADLPAEVRKGFERDHPGAKLKGVEKETYADGTVHYELDYTTPDGKDADVEYDASGEALEKH